MIPIFFKEMTAGKIPQNGTGSIRIDQTGKVFICVGQDLRQCLICEGVFTRRAASEHAKVVLHADYRHETGKVRVADNPGVIA